ncbi:MAG: hypothetical protein CMO81_02285 [Waddliaceae bacterium]|nr:hypothetical protein [Waddliaceae bacterium]
MQVVYFPKVKEIFYVLLQALRPPRSSSGEALAKIHKKALLVLEMVLASLFLQVPQELELAASSLL